MKYGQNANTRTYSLFHSSTPKHTQPILRLSASLGLRHAFHSHPPWMRCSHKCPVSACAAELLLINFTPKKHHWWGLDVWFGRKDGSRTSDGDHRYLGQSGRLIFNHLCLIVVYSASCKWFTQALYVSSSVLILQWLLDDPVELPALELYRV